MRKTERAIFLTEARHMCTENTAWLPCGSSGSPDTDPSRLRLGRTSGVPSSICRCAHGFATKVTVAATVTSLGVRAMLCRQSRTLAIHGGKTTHAAH